MLVPALLTIAAWLLGLFLQFTDGQTFRNDVVLVVAGLLGVTPWIPLLDTRRPTRERRAALAARLLSGCVLLVIAADLPRAYEYQKRFNERAGPRPASPD